MKIRRIKIDIEPCEYIHPSGQVYQLNIRIDTNVGYFTQQKILDDNELESRFDQIFDCAKEQLKNYIKEKCNE